MCIQTRRGQGEEQQCGGVECLSHHEEGPCVGVGVHRVRCPAEGEDETQSATAEGHEEGNDCKKPLGLWD